MAPIHANEDDGTVLHDMRCIAQCPSQKLDELRGIHLPRSEGEFPVLDLAKGRVAVDLRVMGRICKSQVRRLVAKKPAKSLTVSRIPADEAVIAKRPQVVWLGYPAI